MDSNKIPLREVITLAIGEIIVGALICLVFLICGKYDYKVLLGAVLGIAVTLGNFIFLCVSVNRALDKCLMAFDPTSSTPSTPSPEAQSAEEGLENEDSIPSESEPYDDAAAKFARENAGKLQNAIKLSYVVRMATVIASLVVALLTKQFNVIATVIPLLCLRPILNVAELIKRKEKR